ncbi:MULTISPECIES: AMP-binding protein [unclassified Streptomyces]|uniref:AMP-binding protein n=1 Tax=unclassified Streptomyces TaxID=2593676 RepID=UPI002E298B75|nr:AMP-binding protein [Streptomyces sp. NBC_01439]
MHELLTEAVADSAQSRAVSDDTGTWTYAELDAHAHAFADWLAEQGLVPGDRLVVQLPTTRELVAMFYGASRSGVVFVPLNPGMKTFHLAPVLENSEPALVIVTADAEETVRDLTPALVREYGAAWTEVEKHAEIDARPPAAEISADDPAVLVYTSGSTAAPKAVICPHAQITFVSEALEGVIGYRPDDVVFCRFPISWDYGLYKVLLSTIGRSEIVLADGASDLVLLRRIRESGATIVPIVPSLAAMILRLAEREENPAPTVRMFSNTGAALPQTTIDALRAKFPGSRVVRQYGQTESKRITVMPPEQEKERPDSVGRAVPGTQVLILDADGAPLPAGETGEIVAVGPHVMPGYWRNPELSAKTFRPGPDDGALRLHTGDYGWLDEDGYLYFDGRRDDMFKRKGVRMSTTEIESAAADIHGVRAAVVLPPTDERDLVLFVEADRAKHEILRELTFRLEAQKVPSVCHVLDAIPLTPNGKNDKKELARLLEETSK